MDVWVSLQLRPSVAVEIGSVCAEKFSARRRKEKPVTEDQVSLCRIFVLQLYVGMSV